MLGKADLYFIIFLLSVVYTVSLAVFLYKMSFTEDRLINNTEGLSWHQELAFYENWRMLVH